MAFQRPITPPAVGAQSTLRNVTITNNSGRWVIGLSRDRSTFYAATSSGNKLQQSIDDGVTWTDVATFAAAVVGMVELPNGEALVALGVPGATGRLMKSTGWATSHTTATWATVLTPTGGYIRPIWNLNQWSLGSNGVVVVSEYGPQTTSSGDQTAKARRAYLSTDFGSTFTEIFDLVAFGIARGVSNPTGVHVHATCYDEEWDRIWLTYGDNTGDGDLISGSANAQIIYSDDRGATWTHLPQPVEQSGIGYQIQPVTIGTTESAIITLPDSSPYAPMIWPRKGYRQLGSMVLGPYYRGNTGGQGIGSGMSRAHGLRTAPLLTAMTTVAPGIPYLHCSSDGGLTWSELWRDEVSNGGSQGLTALGSSFGAGLPVGPSLGGVILSPYTYNNGGTWTTGSMFKAELVAPENVIYTKQGMTKFSGDGSTTVFQIPHGLGVTPTRKHVLPVSPVAAAALTETMDATNITITFTTAPASGTNNVIFSWKVA